MTYQGALSELNMMAYSNDIPLYHQIALKSIIHEFMDATRKMSETYQVALSELNTIAHNDDVPIYYKFALKEIIHVFNETIRDMPSVTVVS